MRRKVIWIVGVLALVAIPAIVGLAVVGGGDDRRAGALTQLGTGAGYQLVVSGLTPSGEAAEVLSYSWGATANATLVSGSGLAAGKAQFSDLQVAKKIDKTSPLFVKGVSTGQIYPSATLHIYKGASGEKPVEYMTYQMTNVLITSVQHAGSADDVPGENVSLAYAKLQVTTKDLDSSGAVVGQTTFLYDLAAAKG
jgi:type VI secretion system secreted protein Hcp